MKAWLLKKQTSLSPPAHGQMPDPQPVQHQSHGPVTMTPIVINNFNLIWQERSTTSLAHVTRYDAAHFVKIAHAHNIQIGIEVFPFEETQEAMIKVKHEPIKGNAVIRVAAA